MLEDRAGDALPQLAALARRGVQIVIDDFGMGYGTLTYLRAFPVSKIKIDRAFIGAVMDDPRDAAIVRGVAALGSSLGLRVQPEGVETAEQLRFVQELGCTEAQGYLFSRALPEEDFVRFISDWEQRRASVPASVGDVPALVRRLAAGSPVADAPGDPGSVAPDIHDVPHVARAPGWERAFVLAASLVSLWTAAGAMLWLIV
jgi:predicted signal transduction protein with EAL and GGDEF domain